MKYRQWVITFWDMTQIRHYHNKWNFSIDGCRYNALQKKQMDCTLATVHSHLFSIAAVDVCLISGN